MCSVRAPIAARHDQLMAARPGTGVCFCHVEVWRLQLGALTFVVVIVCVKQLCAECATLQLHSLQAGILEVSGLRAQLLRSQWLGCVASLKVALTPPRLPQTVKNKRTWHPCLRRQLIYCSLGHWHRCVFPPVKPLLVYHIQPVASWHHVAGM